MTSVAQDHQGNWNEIRWNQLPSAEHLVHVYTEENSFLDTLEGFVAGGLKAGEGVVVIATPEHRSALEARLRGGGFDLVAAAREDRYISVDAREMLSELMNRGVPDEILFHRCVNRLLDRAGRSGRRVRAFGELVVLLWNEGLTGQTMHLEYLWHDLCHERKFSLLCSYPNTCFDPNADLSVREVCAAHTRTIHG